MPILATASWLVHSTVLSFGTTKPKLPSWYVRTALAQHRHSYHLWYVRIALARHSHNYRLDTSTQLWHAKAIATVSDTSAQLGARQSSSFTDSLYFVCAKTWQTLATVSPSVHLVRSTKTQLSLSHQLTRLYTPTLTMTLQHCNIQSTYDVLYGLP